MSMFKDIPVEVGVIFEGERIRRNDMQVELGGPTVKQKFELAKVKPMNEVEDGKITIVGPDLKTMTLDNMYHVHASWSFPNATLEEWAANLKVMTSKFNGGN